MSFKLPAYLYIPDQIQVCAEELHGLAAYYRRTKRAEEPEISSDIRALVEDLPVAVRTQAEALEALAEELEQTLERNPRVAITLPALPSRALEQELVSWLRSNVKPGVLVAFHVNPDIAGGMIVRTTNKIHDFSFRANLLKEPKRFTEILEHV